MTESVTQSAAQSAAVDFEQGLERYKAGESPESLIPFFKEICERSPKNSVAWACLAWLYLLTDKAELALKAAQKSVKLEKASPQGRINLVLAMLETGKTGVREHIEVAQKVMSLSAELRQDIVENIEDGFAKKPNWKSLERVQKWLDM
ncbi:MAG: hypothetical protein N5P05_000283 [Chroococcopsis gigantea SAG 12.99]|jgi:predicted Zn-dependent protease|nr:hypothetical protein [Chroococcopsis gigantea SAG 12.99]